MPKCIQCKKLFSKKKKNTNKFNFKCKKCLKLNKIKKLKDLVWFLEAHLFQEIPNNISSPLRCALQKNLITSKQYMIQDKNYFLNLLDKCNNKLNKIN